MTHDKYWPAEAAKEIAESDLIPRFHPHLAEARILYLFVGELPATRGKTKLAKVKKAGALEQYLSDADFVLLLDQGEWERMGNAKRRALIDHELCHCTMDRDKFNRPRYGLRAHDLEEFTEIVERHGLWQRDVEAFAEVLQQQELPLKAVS